MHIFLFFIPGILLIFSKAFNRRPLTEFLVYVVGLSLSFFVVLPWFIKYLNVSLMLSTYVVFILSSIFLVIGIKKIEIKHLNIDRQEMVLMGIFLLVLLLRCLPMFFQIAPAGADMSMYSYIARLIYDNDGIPRSYEPLLPISNFSAYPTGFPMLTAIISLLGNFPVFRSSLLMSCLTHALICFGLFIFLSRFFDRNTAAATSIAATFLTRSPQWVIRWGGNPTVLALFFFIIAFSLIIELRGKPSWPKMTLASLFLAATLITHSIIFYVGGIVLLVYFLTSFNDYKNLLASSIGLFIITLVLLLPYLIDLKFTLTKTAIESTRAWQMIDARSVMYDLIAGIPFLIISAFGLPVLFKKNGKSAARMIATKKKHFLIIFLTIGLIYYCVFYLHNSISMCSVTQADLNAFKWMDDTLNNKAVIGNNFGDAGLWIPAITGRAITNPYSEPVNLEELKAGLAKLKAGYIYIGSKAVNGVDYKKENLEKKPWKYRIVYNKDGAQVWKIL
jgi:hypothetical protein